MAGSENNVVALRGAVLPMVPTVNDGVVAKLEELLALARAGEIVGIAGATLHPGNLSDFHYAGIQTRALVGAVEALKYYLVKTENESE
jgi:hypothetical protein